MAHATVPAGKEMPLPQLLLLLIMTYEFDKLFTSKSDHMWKRQGCQVLFAGNEVVEDQQAPSAALCLQYCTQLGMSRRLLCRPKNVSSPPEMAQLVLAAALWAALCCMCKAQGRSALLCNPRGAAGLLHTAFSSSGSHGLCSPPVAAATLLPDSPSVL